jgi:hypothetical protein
MADSFFFEVKYRIICLIIPLAIIGLTATTMSAELKYGPNSPEGFAWQQLMMGRRADFNESVARRSRLWLSRAWRSRAIEVDIAIWTIDLAIIGWSG